MKLSQQHTAPEKKQSNPSPPPDYSANVAGGFTVRAGAPINTRQQKPIRGVHGAVARGRKTMTWREAVDWAIREYREDLDRLREYDLKARKPVKA